MKGHEVQVEHGPGTLGGAFKDCGPFGIGGTDNVEGREWFDEVKSGEAQGIRDWSEDDVEVAVPAIVGVSLRAAVGR